MLSGGAYKIIIVPEVKKTSHNFEKKTHFSPESSESYEYDNYLHHSLLKLQN